MVDYAGAAVGTAFGVLFEVVKDGVKTVGAFRSQLKKIQSTLSSIEPIIKEIDKYNNMLKHPQDLNPIKVLLEKGKGLVSGCSKICMFNLWKVYRYSKDLTAFNEEVLNRFQIYMPLLNEKTCKQILMETKCCRADVEEIRKEVNVQLKKCIHLSQANGAPLQLMPSVNLAAPQAPDFFVGSQMEASLRELKEQLLEEGVSVIVVTGPSGCGKTTLLRKLCHDVDIEGKFKSNIMFVPVSKNSNLTYIVQSMIHHNGFFVPMIPTEDVAVDRLQELLDMIGQNPVLLVLDDVLTEWEKILEKFVFKKIKDYKIVVTSRYELPHYHPVHRLNPLTYSEALELLRQSVIVDDKSIDAPNNGLLDKIMKRCKGSPLALSVVAMSLQGKDFSLWERLPGDRSRLSLGNDILDCIRSSLDSDPSIKERFMDLGSFPEGCEIPATALIDMWVELYELDFDGVRAIADLHELHYRKLAELRVLRRDSGDDNDSYTGHYYSGRYAVQHHLLRELAIIECNRGDIEERVRLILELSGNKFPDWWSEQKQQPLCARLVSISTDENFSTPWPNLELPETEALILNFQNDIQSKNYTLPAFIGNANKLKALLVTNHSFFQAELGNLHVIGSNIRRIRLECVAVSFLSMGNLRLHSLQKISFVRCDISQASTTNDAKISDAMPNLKELDIDNCNNLGTLPEDICEIKPLRKLSITNCREFSALPEQIAKLASLEVVRLNSCLSLSQLPNSFGRIRNLRLLDVRGCQRLTALPLSIVKPRNLKVLYDDDEDSRGRLSRALEGIVHEEQAA